METTTAPSAPDLRVDLDRVLKADFAFHGDFAYGASLSDAPNPYVRIEGVGLVGQPLGDGDAARIALVAKKASSGRGKKAVIRDVWEIDPSKVTFENPGWEQYVNGTILDAVRKALGVSTAPMPRCELRKLQLYQKGSQFLPHQAPEIASGMFATITVLLPSEFAGGELHMIHQDDKKIFDTASWGLMNTAVLAWYTSAALEMKPITSGCCLALSYNLIHNSDSVPRPVIPKMDTAFEKLRTIFREWIAGQYKPKNNTLACLVNVDAHTPMSGQGLPSLKGKDAHKVSCVIRAAKGTGLTVSIARLLCHIEGRIEQPCVYPKRKRQRMAMRYGSDDDDDDDEEAEPYMGNIIRTDITLKGIVRLDDNSRSIKAGAFNISELSLAPVSPFQSLTPDKVRQESFSGTMEHIYRRTALVIYPEHQEVLLELASRGLPHALNLLKASKSAKPNAADLLVIEFIMESLTARDTEAASAMAGHAIEWGDLDMFKRVVTVSGADLRLGIVDNARFGEACKKFGFAALREMFEKALVGTKSFRLRHVFFQSLASSVGSKEKAMVMKWSQDQVGEVIHSLANPTVNDVPSLVLAFSVSDPETLKSNVIPTLSKLSANYAFWQSFIKEIQQAKVDARPTADSPRANNLDEVTRACLNALIPQWDSHIQPSYSLYQTDVNQLSRGRIDRFIEIVDMCIRVGHRQACTQLCSQATKEIADKEYTTFYIPLLKSLKDALLKHALQLSDAPFAAWIKLLIEQYLTQIVKQNPSALSLKQIGCSPTCTDCRSLDAFLFSSEKTFNFQYNKQRRSHLESRLPLAQHLISHSTVEDRMPYTLVIMKLPPAIATCEWMVHVSNARMMLDNIGVDVARKIMGQRYADVTKALDGSVPYVASEVRIPTAVTAPMTAPKARTSGTKRKSLA